MMKIYEYRATLTLSNLGGIGIVNIVNGIDDYVEYQMNYNGQVGRLHKTRIRYNTAGNPYVVIKGIRYYLSEFLKVQR